MKFFERVEAALEKRHHHALTTRLRRLELLFASTKSTQIQEEWLKQRHIEEMGRFAMLQREIYIKEEVATRLKTSKSRLLTTEEETELRAWEDELEGFDRRYCLHKLVSYNLEHQMPKGPLIREWDALNRKREVLSRENEFRCAANGGCCKRGCGCCEKPLNSHREQGIYGHCSTECGCCARSRKYYGD